MAKQLERGSLPLALAPEALHRNGPAHDGLAAEVISP
jgi:hypothetical protein